MYIQRSSAGARRVRNEAALLTTLAAALRTAEGEGDAGGAEREEGDAGGAEREEAAARAAVRGALELRILPDAPSTPLRDLGPLLGGAFAVVGAM